MIIKGHMKKSKAFTIIEIVVVIAIIGTLVSIVLFSLNNAKQKSRDAQRKNDLRRLETALEVYASDNVEAKYPPSPNRTPVDEALKSLVGEKSYIRDLPQDPLSSRRYYYQTDSESKNYTLMADLENEKEQGKDAAPSWAKPKTDDYFVVNKTK